MSLTVAVCRWSLSPDTGACPLSGIIEILNNSKSNFELQQYMCTYVELPLALKLDSKINVFLLPFLFNINMSLCTFDIDVLVNFTIPLGVSSRVN